MSKKKPLSPELLEECRAAHALFLKKKNEKNLSQKKIADAAGISAPAVNLYFKGTNALNLHFAMVLSRLLEEPIESFSERLAFEQRLIAHHNSLIDEIDDELGLQPLDGPALIARDKARKAAEAPAKPPASSLEAVISQISSASTAGRLSESDLDFLQSTAAYLEGRESSSREHGERASPYRGMRLVGKENDALDSDESVVARTDLGVTESSTDWSEYAFVDQFDAKAAAGSGYDNTHVVLRNTLAFKREWLRVKGVKPDNLLVMYAEGDSMWPTINDHDVLLVDQSKIEPATGHVFVLSSTDKGAIVKRLVQSPLGGWIVRSDNDAKDEYPDLLLSRSEVNEHRIIGRVIWRGGDL